MASNHAVVLALGVLGRAFAGVVDEARVDVYAKALEDISDADLSTAVDRVVKTHTGEFIPPPAVLRKAIAPAPLAVDSDALVREIASLGTYTPSRGMVPPTRAIVEHALGELVAYAYVSAGGPRLLSDDETTSSIARREFEKAMREGSTALALPVIGPGAAEPRVAGLVTDTTRLIGRGMERSDG